MQTVRFIHAADLHLGSIIQGSGETPSSLTSLWLQSGYQAFARICRAAIAHQIDFLLLAGDIYDRQSRSVYAARFFNQQCRRLEEHGINVYMISGNHDPQPEGGELLELPANVYLFSSEEVESVEMVNDRGVPVARILGQSYRGPADSRKMYSSYTVPDHSLWNIALLHTQLDPGNRDYVPCSLSDLLSREGIDYWALGHIHQTRILHHSTPVAAYPGIPQGRDIGEEGNGGALLVELRADRPADLKFIPTAALYWRQIELYPGSEPVSQPVDDSEEPGNLTELKQYMLDRAENLLVQRPTLPEGLELAGKEPEDPFAGYLVRWVLGGRCLIHQMLAEQGGEALGFLTESLRRNLHNRRPFVWTESIVDRTRVHLTDIDALLEENPGYKEIDKIAELCLREEGLKHQLQDRIGQIWSAELDHEDGDEKRFQLNQQSLEMFLEQARQLIIEELINGGERS